MESEYSPWKSKTGGGDGGRRGGGGAGTMAAPPSSAMVHLLPPVMEVEEDAPQPDTLLRLGNTWPS